ncbi:hypothetical protein [Flavihumibacter sp. ZG627]|uniref:hypothetical protein n=1 Tax=Flavihumibacter sp. ZG627 TaxID=1463156 RepID=UPI000B0DA5DD|nr:hypothetical protein [Flavihumibacter sp. ZG627]
MPTMKLTQPSLALCLLLDAVGYFTYAMPFLGEFGDLVWAPISGLIYYKLFGGWRGALGGFFSFAEEILPFTDFIPTFTLGYIAQRLGKKKPQSGMVTVAK